MRELLKSSQVRCSFVPIFPSGAENFRLIISDDGSVVFKYMKKEFGFLPVTISRLATPTLIGNSDIRVMLVGVDN